MKIFLVQDGEPEGPFTEEEIRAQLKSGELDAGTFATVEGMAEWKPVTEVLPLAEPPPSLASLWPSLLSIGPHGQNVAQ